MTPPESRFYLPPIESPIIEAAKHGGYVVRVQGSDDPPLYAGPIDGALFVAGQALTQTREIPL